MPFSFFVPVTVVLDITVSGHRGSSLLHTIIRVEDCDLFHFSTVLESRKSGKHFHSPAEGNWDRTTRPMILSNDPSIQEDAGVKRCRRDPITFFIASNTPFPMSNWQDHMNGKMVFIRRVLTTIVQIIRKIHARQLWELTFGKVFLRN